MIDRAFPSSTADALAEWPEDHRVTCAACRNKSGMFCLALTRQCGRHITHVPVDVLHDCSDFSRRGA